LKQLLGGQGKKDQQVFGALAGQLKVVASWSTDLRYQVGYRNPKEAQQFCGAARAIRDRCFRS